MGKEIEKGERERRSFEHVAVRSITNVGWGRGCFCSCSFLLHERRDSSFSSFSSTTCSLDGFRMAMGGGGGSFLRLRSNLPSHHLACCSNAGVMRSLVLLLYCAVILRSL